MGLEDQVLRYYFQRSTEKLWGLIDEWYEDYDTSRRYAVVMIDLLNPDTDADAINNWSDLVDWEDFVEVNEMEALAWLASAK